MAAVPLRTRTARVNGVDLQLIDEGDGPLVVLAHGWPELAYSWRYQIPALAAAGYRVIAPDQRGYGRSTRPDAIEDYDIVHLTGDLTALLDEVGEEQAVFVGHDWGSMVVWQLALLAPERVRGVVGMSVPFFPRAPMEPTRLFKQAFGDTFFYILYFQQPGVADEDLGRDPAMTLRRLLAATPRVDGDAPIPMLEANDGRGFVERLPEPAGLPAWLAPAELDHYISEFSRTGFTGGINWYRNFDRNWRLTEHVDGAKVAAPSLFVAGAADPVVVMTPPAVMDGWLTDHRGTVMIDGAGHWVQQERPAEVNDALLTFLRGLG